MKAPTGPFDRPAAAMASLLFLFCMSGMAIASNAAELKPSGTHLFILSGQSNMAGLDPDLSFRPAVEARFGAENVLIIKDAQGGQPIRRWVSDWKDAKGVAPDSAGDLYRRLIKKLPHSGDRPLTGWQSVTFIWMQGERDAREKHGTVYLDSLRSLTRQLQDDLRTREINVVIGRLSDFDLADERYPHWTLVRRQQQAFAESGPFIRMVDTDDLNGPDDDLHYTRDGYRILGERFAAEAISLIGERFKKETLP